MIDPEQALEMVALFRRVAARVAEGQEYHIKHTMGPVVRDICDALEEEIAELPGVVKSPNVRIVRGGRP